MPKASMLASRLDARRVEKQGTDAAPPPHPASISIVDDDSDQEPEVEVNGLTTLE